MTIPFQTSKAIRAIGETGNVLKNAVSVPTFFEEEGLTSVAWLDTNYESIDVPDFVDEEELDLHPWFVVFVPPFVGAEWMQVLVGPGIDLFPFVDQEEVFFPSITIQFVERFPPFVEVEVFTAWNTNVIYEFAFHENEDFYYIKPTPTFKSGWGFVNSLNVGMNVVISTPLGVQKDVFMRGQISDTLRSSFLFKNTLCSNPVNPGWSVGNELTVKDSVTAIWGVTNIIGTKDLNMVSGFWNQGPVVHRAESGGGYE